LSDELQKRILETTYTLFSQIGIEKVTLRDIAAECGISLGNLTYHYQKKEYLFAAVYKEMLQTTHDRFREHFSSQNGKMHPWATYVGINYAHLHTVAHAEHGISDYIYSTRFPAAREAYVAANCELMLKCLTDTPYKENRQKIKIACMIGCGGEFEAMYTYSARKEDYDFDQLIAPTFSARLYLAGVSSGEIDDLVTLGIQKGKYLLTEQE
jgi:AcrR family transcriptional regulator